MRGTKKTPLQFPAPKTLGEMEFNLWHSKAKKFVLRNSGAQIFLAVELAAQIFLSTAYQACVSAKSAETWAAGDALSRLVGRSKGEKSQKKVQNISKLQTNLQLLSETKKNQFTSDKGLKV